MMLAWYNYANELFENYSSISLLANFIFMLNQEQLTTLSNFLNRQAGLPADIQAIADALKESLAPVIAEETAANAPEAPVETAVDESASNSNEEEVAPSEVPVEESSVVTDEAPASDDQSGESSDSSEDNSESNG